MIGERKKEKIVILTMASWIALYHIVNIKYRNLH